jgi:uncharacterized membrane protein
MDGWLILLRIVHVGSAMSWFGGAILAGFFLQPTAAALGQAGQPFMDHLVHRRRMGIFFPAIAGLTILSGAALYWRDSGGLQAAWISSPTGLAFTIGGLAAIAAFVGGFILIGPGIAEQTAVQNELAAGDGAPTEAQRQRLERAGRRLQLASRIDWPLLLLAGLTMAVARYL